MDPWEAIEPNPTTDDGINPDLVMSPAQLRAVAAACATVDPRYAAFVLTQGPCGLRPGEAQALRCRGASNRPSAIHPGATGKLTLRADSGFYAGAVVSACRRHKVAFSVTARKNTAIQRAIAAIPDDAWMPIP